MTPTTEGLEEQLTSIQGSIGWVRSRLGELMGGINIDMPKMMSSNRSVHSELERILPTLQKASNDIDKLVKTLGDKR